MSTATVATLAPSMLLSDALADARTVLAAAKQADIHDHTDMVRSQTALTTTLRRVLWALNAETVS